LTHQPGLTVYYDNDWSTVVFLLIVLGAVLHPLILDEEEDVAMILGAIVFGFYLFIPACYALSRLDHLRVGAWLGLCTLLIPTGAYLARGADRPTGSDIGRPARSAVFLAASGVILCLLGLPSKAWSVPNEAGSVPGVNRSIWSLPRLGHTPGALILILAVLIGIFILAMVAATKHALRFRNVARLLAAVICGLGVWYAITYVDYLGLGAWFEAIGSVATLGGTLWLCESIEIADGSGFDDLIASRGTGPHLSPGAINRQRLSS
jgi:hypothetical protein